ncbi:BhlA/UviB family holin-like peptide [Clostridium sp.]|uniref:BhlA/UviB family holin-like peptide n=1 Tax=Clostridium sp. TaxID=1506 RepID=UPI003D6C8A87
MENELIKMASTQGIWTALSVALIFYILKTQEKRDIKQEEREQNYQNIIENLTVKLDVVDNIKKNVQEIKETMINKKI